MTLLRDTEFAVVDVETTGLFPQRHDRIIEIAIVRIDSKGKTLDEYASLVNPLRDMGPSYIHGITSRDVTNAPVFKEIAGDILRLLAGAVFVAHNVHFDMRFVESEIAQARCRLPSIPCLCTMRLGRQADPRIPGRKLHELCDHFGIPLERIHTALGDARATATLMTRCVAKMGNVTDLSLDDIGVLGGSPCKRLWPTIPVSRQPYPREEAAQAISLEPSYISRLVAKLPAMSNSSPEIEEYLSLLDRALEDRRVTSEEADALFSLAEELGLSREQAANAHQVYMRDLIRVALEDGVITLPEREDLDEVRNLLDVPKTVYDKLLDEVKKAGGRVAGGAAEKNQADIVGMSVCFTGAFNCQIDGDPVTRSLAEQIASERGMVVKARVTKQLDYLVTADPDSMSGKARKARGYGVRIIAEIAFWRMVGVDVQ